MKKPASRGRRKPNKYYSNGNLAYDNPHEEVRKKQPLQKIKQPKTTYGVSNALRLVFCIGVVFVGCIITMESYAKVQEKSIHISNMLDELNKMKSDNNALEAEITGKLDMAYIEEQAKTRLGMSDPQPYQIIYVDVPKQSYTVQQNIPKEEQKKGFSLKWIIDLFN